MNLFTPDDISTIIKYIDGEFVAHIDGYVLKSVFQSIHYSVGLDIYGFEALVRIYKGDEVINPIDFFSGYDGETEITNIGIVCYAIHVRNAKKLNLENRRIFINAHPKMFNRISDDIFSVHKTLDVLSDLNISPQQIVFEITEYKEGDFNSFKKGVERFRNLGVSIAIDDYGKDESTEERVKKIVPDIVKIDRSVIIENYRNPNLGLLKDVINRIKESGSLIILEGVENDQIYCSISGLEFDFIQGYFLSYPQSPIDIKCT